MEGKRKWITQLVIPILYNTLQYNNTIIYLTTLTSKSTLSARSKYERGLHIQF